jgi:hypothetical protein
MTLQPHPHVAHPHRHTHSATHVLCNTRWRAALSRACCSRVVSSACSPAAAAWPRPPGAAGRPACPCPHPRPPWWQEEEKRRRRKGRSANTCTGAGATSKAGDGRPSNESASRNNPQPHYNKATSQPQSKSRCTTSMAGRKTSERKEGRRDTSEKRSQERKERTRQRREMKKGQAQTCPPTYQLAYLLAHPPTYLPTLTYLHT